VNEPAIRTVEHTNYHLSSIFTDNGYGLEKCGVVDEWNLATDAGKMSMKEKMQGLSLPLLSEKSGGEILRKRGIENGFTE